VTNRDTIRIVARKERAELWRDGRTRLAVGALLSLLTGAAAAGRAARSAIDRGGLSCQWRPARSLVISPRPAVGVGVICPVAGGESADEPGRQGPIRPVPLTPRTRFIVTIVYCSAAFAKCRTWA
jgi:hypothetical protein